MITRYVNTASTPGGDGTTNDTGGASRAFASLVEALAPYFGGALPDHVLLVCSGVASDVTSNPSTPGFFEPFSFSTTPANYLEIVGDNVSGKWNPNAYRIEITNMSGLGGSSAAHVRILNLQIMLKTTDGGTHVMIRPSSSFWNTAGGAGHWIVKNSILRVDPSGSSGFAVGARSHDPGGSSGTVRLINVEHFGHSTRSGNAFETDDGSWATSNVFNYNGTGYRGYINFVNKQICVNCLGAEAWSGIDFQLNTPGPGTDYNASTDATAPGTTNRRNQTFSFVDPSSGDLRLLPTDAGALGFGLVDPAAGLYLDDMTGSTRPAAWAIGALEASRTAVRRRTLGPKIGTRAN